MKVVRKKCCGLDVHKTLVVATIAATSEEGITSHGQRSFGAPDDDLCELRDWLVERDAPPVCMESTGKYRVPIHDVLEGEVEEVCPAHPKYVRATRGKKTDKKDSKRVADLYKCDLVRSSPVPPRDIRECREIARYRSKLVRMRSL